MNPHTENITALSYGKLVHENLSQLELIRSLEVKVEMQKHLVLRAQEECKRAQEQRNAATRACDHFKRSNDAFTKVVDDLQKEVRGLKNELSEERNAYSALKARFHGANYGIGPDAFRDAVLGKTTTEVMEENNLKAKLEQTEAHLKKRISELINERDAHNKLKAQFVRHGIDPFCHDGMGHPAPQVWKAIFKWGDKVMGTYSWDRCPQDWELEKLRSRFQANSWKLILP